jgi:hypothetical protein
MIGVLGFDSRRGLGIFQFTTASRTVLGSTQIPIQWVSGALSLVVKRPGREADHSPPSSAEVKKASLKLFIMRQALGRFKLVSQLLKLLRLGFIKN